MGTKESIKLALQDGAMQRPALGLLDDGEEYTIDFNMLKKTDHPS